MTEKDVLTEIKEEPMSMFKKKDVTEKVMGDLLKNPHLAPLVGDLSKFGVEKAAKTAKVNATNAFFAVASLFELPVADASFDAVTNLFAPCCESEFLRVLKPGGHLILVGAGEQHLMGLKKVLYDTQYLNPERNDLPKDMELVEKRNLHTTISVKDNEMIRALFSMTPYYWRTSPADSQKLDHLDTLETELDFDIYIYRKAL